MGAGHLILRHNHRGPGNEAGNSHGPVLPSGVPSDQVSVAVLNGKSNIGNRLSSDTILFRERQRTERRVVEVEVLRVIAGVDDHSLATGFRVDGESRGTGHLSCNNGARDIGNDDLALLIRPIQAVGGKLAAFGIHHLTVRIGQLKLCPLNRGFVQA